MKRQEVTIDSFNDFGDLLEVIASDVLKMPLEVVMANFCVPRTGIEVIDAMQVIKNAKIDFQLKLSFVPREVPESTSTMIPGPHANLKKSTKVSALENQAKAIHNPEIVEIIPDSPAAVKMTEVKEPPRMSPNNFPSPPTFT